MKKILAENKKFTQFIEQDFPVVEKNYSSYSIKKVKIIGFCNPKKTYECHFFRVEVVKDCDGFISFIVTGDGRLVNDPDSDLNGNIRIMRTDDFNQAYDLKNKLDTLLGDFIPNEKQKMHCYDSLQREKTMWER